MATVDLTRSLALRALRRDRRVHGLGWLIGRWVLRLVALLAVGLILLDFSQSGVTQPVLIITAYLGLGLVILPLILDLYARTKWSALPDLPPLASLLASQPAPNLADFLSLAAAAIVTRAQLEQRRAGAENLAARFFLAAALNERDSQSILSRSGLFVPTEAVDQIIKAAPNTGEPEPDFSHLLELAAEQVLQDQRSLIDEGDLLLALLDSDPVTKKLAFDAHLTKEELAMAIAWQRRFRAAFQEPPAYERPVGAGIAQDWTAGYTPFLSHFSHNLTKQVAAATHSHVVHGRDKEIITLERWLAKQRGHNVLLVGEQGIGKQSIIRGLAVRMTLGTSQFNLRYHQVLALDIPTLLAGVSDRGAIESRLLHVFADAAQAGNIILYIEDIHLLVGGGDRVAGVDATEILLNALRASSLYVVATTSPQEYQQRIGSNSAVAGLFERLDVTPVDAAATLEILEDSVPSIESESQTFFTVQALQEIIRLSDRYLHDQPFPQKALNLLLELGAAAHDSGQRLVGPETVQSVLSDKLKVPLQNADSGERDKLLHLGKELHKTVIAQDEAISAIVAALQRARAGLSSGKRPIASFLFLGPTGVGKTESAKALARVYFGNQERMIRLDMSEYQQSDGLVRLLGAPGAASGVKVGGNFVDQVHDQPFSLILLDELEKAHPQILNLFLQVLDDGRLTDGTGRLIDFTNTIIIATSNAGAELIRGSIAAGEDQDSRRAKLINHLQEEGIYRPEFLNRFDGIVAFHPLAPEHVAEIVRLMLAGLAAKLASEQEITVTFADDLVLSIAQTGFDPQFGARPIRRLIQDTVEHYLAQRILEGKLARGQSITLSAAQIGLAKTA